MSRRDSVLLMLLLVAALLLHAALPRYEWRQAVGAPANEWVRIDHWTGRAEWRRFELTGAQRGTWVPAH